MSEFPPTRGFTGRPRVGRPDRLPPGQYDTGADWPTLTAEVTPHLVPDEWTMTVDGLVEHPVTWTWREIHALPGSSYFGDIHCVTTWSKLDTTFTGVSVDTLLELAGPPCSTGSGRPSYSQTTQARPPVRSASGRLVV